MEVEVAEEVTVEVLTDHREAADMAETLAEVTLLRMVKGDRALEW